MFGKGNVRVKRSGKGYNLNGNGNGKGNVRHDGKGKGAGKGRRTLVVGNSTVERVEWLQAKVAKLKNHQWDASQFLYELVGDGGSAYQSCFADIGDDPRGFRILETMVPALALRDVQQALEASRANLAFLPLLGAATSRAWDRVANNAASAAPFDQRGKMLNTLRVLFHLLGLDPLKFWVLQPACTSLLAGAVCEEFENDLEIQGLSSCVSMPPCVERGPRTKRRPRTKMQPPPQQSNLDKAADMARRVPPRTPSLKIWRPSGEECRLPDGARLSLRRRRRQQRNQWQGGSTTGTQQWGGGGSGRSSGGWWRRWRRRRRRRRGAHSRPAAPCDTAQPRSRRVSLHGGLPRHALHSAPRRLPGCTAPCPEGTLASRRWRWWWSDPSRGKLTPNRCFVFKWITFFFFFNQSCSAGRARPTRTPVPSECL